MKQKAQTDLLRKQIETSLQRIEDVAASELAAIETRCRQLNEIEGITFEYNESVKQRIDVIIEGLSEYSMTFLNKSVDIHNANN